MPTDFLSVLREFQDRNVRYVLVGGLAVLLHGIDRLTADIDLVVDLAPDNASKAVETLLELGFRASAPIEPRQFADAAVRKRWQSEFGMLVLSFWDPENPRPTVDLFADCPTDFEALYQDSTSMALAISTVRVASLGHLIAIKRAAGGPKDLDDVERLIEVIRRKKLPMASDVTKRAAPNFGSWQEAQELRKWSFLQRTPQQRLDWLVQALTVAYECGALHQHASLTWH
jgi:predicted nucleotidyltransferase